MHALPESKFQVDRGNVSDQADELEIDSGEDGTSQEIRGCVDSDDERITLCLLDARVSRWADAAGLNGFAHMEP
ncbi:uncharacterized protein ACLA_005870 [Aspergillus clavatus NRRL 1]|uniref:Uncharacterized protein n=1 Tax=Aspergillus clavatus (strain ATCC 1007 / CBS 513.65 / DSM 816 / NCTC 3887 / NRRL 1 / QM 1276 / 107) TaxID=344612 RepID=A1CDA4_ASPCL|nr:uncharacterized protein ACLA_005870 [Aspergillus clavatus NRRL 1]EAW11831.1 hypothetical protein ACLA_005870 [Aspergillus clavatus NRRL 1]